MGFRSRLLAGLPKGATQKIANKQPSIGSAVSGQPSLDAQPPQQMPPQTPLAVPQEPTLAKNTISPVGSELENYFKNFAPNPPVNPEAFGFTGKFHTLPARLPSNMKPQFGGFGKAVSTPESKARFADLLAKLKMGGK